MFVPGSAELLNIDESGSGEVPCYNERGEIPYNKRLEEHPELAYFFERMTYVPLAGKTTTLTALINRLKSKYRIGEMDVDIESSLDAQKVADLTGVPSIQIHNCGLCHIDADMVSRAFIEYDTTGLDLLIMENIGNLVCPAEFDTGAHYNIMILSVPEGDDKPLKYPLMFRTSDLVLINKIDTMEYFDFDLELARKRILDLNPNAVILPISARTGEGLDAVEKWIEERMEKQIAF